MEVKENLEGYSRLGIEAFAAVAKSWIGDDSGSRRKSPRKNRGSLVISQVLDDTAAFERMLRNLRDFLTVA